MEPAAQNPVWTKIRVQVFRYLSLIRRHWWLLPLTVSIGSCLAAWFVAQMPPAYMSSARMIVSPQLQMNTGTAYNEDQSDFYGTQVEMMMDSEVRQHALARVQTLYPGMPPEEVDYKADLIPHTSMFYLTATAANPLFAQAYLDACMDEFIEKKREERRDTTDSTTVAISNEMASLDKEIQTTDDAILAFQKQNNIGFLEEEGNSAAKHLAQLNQQLSDLTTEYNLLKMLDVDQALDRESSMAAAASSSSSTTTTTASDGSTTSTDSPDMTVASQGPIADYQHERQALALMRAELADMSTRLKPKHPKRIDLEQKIKEGETLLATLRAQSTEALKTHLDSMALEIQNLKQVIAQEETKALDLSGRLSEFERLKTKSDRAKAEYDRQLSNLHSVDVTKNVGGDTVQVEERASQAISVKPGLARIFLIGSGGGLLLGLLIIFVLDQLDDRISSLMELQTHFPEHLLGQIPQDKLDSENALLQPGDDRQALIESFRTLRSSLIFLPVEGKRPKTLLITSALPDEGKTTVSSNLAVTLAFSGAKTLLVDADMRSGKVSHLFGAGDSPGLSSILSQKGKWSEYVSMTWIDNLYLLPAGPPLHHTSEHLLGKVTDQFLRDIYDQFDYVVFDSPPVIILDDTLSLSPKIDATLFVIRFNQSSVRSSRRALDLLTRRQANVIGTICNDVSLAETEYNYNYSYRTYGTKYREVKTEV
jgi:capsular exopolysaccharide synthesis family protein